LKSGLAGLEGGVDPGPAGITAARCGRLPLAPTGVFTDDTYVAYRKVDKIALMFGIVVKRQTTGRTADG
jgi:hypothetical protein